MSGEKTFAPTEKRKRDAALKGDVLRSRDLGTAVAMLVGAVWLKFAGPWLMAALVQGARRGLDWDRGAIDQFDPGSAMLALTSAVLPPLVVLAGSVMIAVLPSIVSSTVIVTELLAGFGNILKSTAFCKSLTDVVVVGLNR